MKRAHTLHTDALMFLSVYQLLGPHRTIASSERLRKLIETHGAVAVLADWLDRLAELPYIEEQMILPLYEVAELLRALDREPA